MTDNNLEVEELHVELSVKDFHLKKAEIIALSITVISALVLATVEVYFRFNGHQFI